MKELNEKYGSEEPRKSSRKQPIIREGEWTYDDYAALDDDNRYEIAGGKLELMSPGPNLIHQMISSEMAGVLRQTCELDYIILSAPLDVILSPKEVRQPDLILVRRDRMHILSKRGIEGPPDLVVEILSPSTRRRDRIDKMKAYARYLVPEYWVVDPEAGALEQYVLTDVRYELVNIYQGEDRVSSTSFPCVSFTMKEIMDTIPELD